MAREVWTKALDPSPEVVAGGQVLKTSITSFSDAKLPNFPLDPAELHVTLAEKFFGLTQLKSGFSSLI